MDATISDVGHYYHHSRELRTHMSNAQVFGGVAMMSGCLGYLHQLPAIGVLFVISFVVAVYSFIKQYRSRKQVIYYEPRAQMFIRFYNNILKRDRPQEVLDEVA